MVAQRRKMRDKRRRYPHQSWGGVEHTAGLKSEGASAILVKENLEELAKIDLGIISDIQTLSQAFDGRIIADDGGVEDDFLDGGEFPDDGMPHDGAFDLCRSSDGNIGTDDGMRYLGGWMDVDRGDDDAIRVF